MCVCVIPDGVTAPLAPLSHVVIRVARGPTMLLVYFGYGSLQACPLIFRSLPFFDSGVLLFSVVRCLYYRLWGYAPLRPYQCRFEAGTLYAYVPDRLYHLQDRGVVLVPDGLDPYVGEAMLRTCVLGIHDVVLIRLNHGGLCPCLALNKHLDLHLCLVSCTGPLGRKVIDLDAGVPWLFHMISMDSLRFREVVHRSAHSDVLVPVHRPLIPLCAGSFYRCFMLMYPHSFC